MEIAPGYPIDRWRNDPEVDRVAQSFLRTLTAKSPYFDPLTDPAALNRSLGEEVYFGGQAAIGLGVALWLDALALSFASAPEWSTSRLTVTLRTLGEDAELLEEHAEVNHASRSDHLADHARWLHDAMTEDVKSGRQFWEARAEIFPNLSFCQSVGANVTNMLEGDDALRHVLRRLRDLNDYAEEWTSGPFDSSAIANASPETETTIDQYGDVRTFTCPDGQSRVFSWHVRCTPGAIRVHFLPIEHSIIIGYIGPHLPTAKFN